MYARFSPAFLRIFRSAIVLALVIAGCEQPPPVHKTPPPEETSPVGKIVYRIEVLSDRAADVSTFRRTVYFDGKRSAVTEETGDYGFPGTTTVFASGRDSEETYVKALPYVTFRLQRERTVPDEMDAQPVQHKPFTKTILGYRCKQLILETEQFRYAVWYTTDVTVHDPTQSVIRNPNVPGLILEMDKTLKGRKGWHTLVVVTAFEPTGESSAMLEIPKEAVAVADANEALVQNRLLFEEAMQREEPLSQEAQQQFLGTWYGKENGQAITLKIERYGEAYTFSERKAAGTAKGIARFYGNRLLLEENGTWRTYYEKNGNLRSDQDEELVLSRNSTNR